MVLARQDQGWTADDITAALEPVDGRHWQGNPTMALGHMNMAI